MLSSLTSFTGGGGLSADSTQETNAHSGDISHGGVNVSVAPPREDLTQAYKGFAILGAIGLVLMFAYKKIKG